MERSTKIGLAAGFVALAGAVYFDMQDSSEGPDVPSQAVDACMVGGNRTKKDCADEVKAAYVDFQKQEVPLSVGNPSAITTQPAAPAAPVSINVPSSGQTSSSGGHQFSFLDYYLMHRLLNPDTGRVEYRDRTQYVPVPSSSFNRNADTAPQTNKTFVSTPSYMPSNDVAPRSAAPQADVSPSLHVSPPLSVTGAPKTSVPSVGSSFSSGTATVAKPAVIPSAPKTSVPSVTSTMKFSSPSSSSSFRSSPSPGRR